MLWRINDQTLLIRVEVDLDNYLALEKAVVYDGAEHLLVTEALVDDTDDHTSALVKCARGLSTSTTHWHILMLLVLDLKAPEMLTKAVSIRGKKSSCLVKIEPLFASLGLKLSAHEIRRLGVGGR